jgi:glycerol-3-phosphate dehydrogenase
LETQVLIIGGGITGTGLARDLALRGVPCVLAEQWDINAGASGSNHGLLHSGARYVANDPSAARECREEGDLLKDLGPHCIEKTGGLFVAVEGDDEHYVADFPTLCSRCGIPVHALDVKEARELEPALSERLIAAYRVEDATIDPFKLSLENMWQAQDLGAVLLRNTRVVGFKRDGKRIESVTLREARTGDEKVIRVEQVVNATGAWAGEVAARAGLTIDMLYSKGTLLVTLDRITRHVVNRLRPPSNADILVPGGTVSLLGTTSVRMHSLDQVYPIVEEVDLIVDEESAMVPLLASTRYLRAYAGVRPLVGPRDDRDARAVSRGFTLLDHERDGLENFATITGGKFTTYRLMAEKTADLVCQRLGVESPCRTRTDPLPSTYACKWTETGVAPQEWLRTHHPGDLILCECEMVPQSAVDGVVASIRRRNDRPDLESIGLRSRIGKGPCQGTFCSVKIASHLYEREEIRPEEGLGHVRHFVRGRWRGQHPILWGGQLIQAELMESWHCGLFCQELYAES